ncbi:MAG TPA: hypothetical protein VFZ54_09925 [Burkholderiales bacterium]
MMRALCLALLLSIAQVAGAQNEELRAEMVFWESVRSSTDPADYRAYLEQYPNGKFAPLARNRLAALGAKPAAPAPSAAPAATPQPAAPRKEGLAVGDAWTYRVARAGAAATTQEVRLTAVNPAEVIEEISGEGKVLRVAHRPGAYLTPVGEMTLFSPYLFSLGPSAVPGTALRVENYDSRTCNAGWGCGLSARVIGRERVQVLAGTFEALRVEVRQSWTSPAQTNDRGEIVSRTMTVWYVPEVGRAVKVVSQGSPSRYVDTQYELELARYQLKP